MTKTNRLEEIKHQEELVAHLEIERGIIVDITEGTKKDYLNAKTLPHKIALLDTYRVLTDALSDLYRGYVKAKGKLESLKAEEARKDDKHTLEEYRR